MALLLLQQHCTCYYLTVKMFDGLKIISLAHHYDLLLPNFGGHDSTADSAQNNAGLHIFFAFQLCFFLYFALNFIVTTIL